MPVNINISVGITTDTVPKFLEALRALRDTQVLVGVPDSTAGRESSKKGREEINNAALLYIHNYGNAERNIPARPTVEPGIKDANERIVGLMKTAGQRALRGQSIEESLDAVGLTAQVAIQKRIRSNTPPPLAASTIAARKRRGVTRTNTLVDTGKLLQSIRYVKRRKSRA